VAVKLLVKHLLGGLRGSARRPVPPAAPRLARPSLEGLEDRAVPSVINRSMGLMPDGVVVADFNHDNLPDVATANNGSNTVSVRLNRNNGTLFQANSLPPFAVGGGPTAIAVGQFDNFNNNLDLVVTNSTDGTVSLLLGQPPLTGGFVAFKPSPFRSSPLLPLGTFAVGGSPSAIVVGDFNRDNFLDLAVTNSADGTVSILYGKGTGNFYPTQQVLTVGGGPSAIVAADFDGNGFLDLAVANASDKTVSVLYGSGHGVFSSQRVYTVGANPSGLAAGILTIGSFHPSLAVANQDDDTVSILRGVGGTGTAAFKAQPLVHTGAGSKPVAVRLADVNNNGNLDLLVANSGTNTIGVFLGGLNPTTGTQQFVPLQNVPVGAGASPVALAVGDFNHDNLIDVAVADADNSMVSILIHNKVGAPY
jgi:hypothetical protein